MRNTIGEMYKIDYRVPERFQMRRDGGFGLMYVQKMAQMDAATAKYWTRA